LLVTADTCAAAAIEICRAALAARRLDNQLNDDSPPPADGDASS
jgi:hypothetical protein